MTAQTTAAICTYTTSVWARNPDYDPDVEGSQTRILTDRHEGLTLHQAEQWLRDISVARGEQRWDVYVTAFVNGQLLDDVYASTPATIYAPISYVKLRRHDDVVMVRGREVPPLEEALDTLRRIEPTYHTIQKYLARENAAEQEG